MSMAVDPNAVGGQVLSEVGSHGGVHPDSVTVETPAPVTESVVEEAPKPKDGELDYGDVDITKLSPAEQKTAKQFQAAYTKARQKDSDAARTAQTELEQLGWARDLSRLMASADPADRQQGAAILRASLHVLEPPSTDKAPPDPLASMDWDSVEAVAPGLPGVVQHLIGQINTMREQLGGAVSTTTSLAQARADAELSTELSAVEADAKKGGLPFDEQRVLKTAIDRGIKNVRDAYHAAYGLELVEAGKQAALKGLQTKKAAALPGAGPAAGVTETRPKFKDMHEAYAWAKRERGITGDLT